ncbi:MAG: hypothetical protein KDC53_11410 [Saprospiraceae bacterium]|nr:hypothetical protein [Saprospiraceae bacterium]
MKKEDGIPWTIYEKGTGVIGPCGCYFGPCSDLLIEYRNHPYLDPSTALSKVVCRNPCLLKDMYEYQYFVPQYSQWMEEVNKMFMGMLAIGMAPLAAAAAVEIIPMAVPILETIVTINVRTKGTEFVTGFCIDIALNGAIEYYFLDNPHPFNNIDLAQATASGLEAMIDTKNKIYEVIGAAALSCLTDGFTEDGKIRDEFEVVECGKGILSSVITDIALFGGSKALNQLGNIPKGKLIKGLFKIFPSSSYGTATAGGGGPPNLVWTVFKHLHNGELDADAVKAFFDITDDDIAQRIVSNLADQQVLDDLMGSGFYNFLRNLDWPESVKADLVDDLAGDKVFRDAIAGSDALVKAWETLIAHPLIRKDIATLKSINKILDNAGIANIISKEDLQMSVKKLAEKGVKCRTCLSGNPAYRYLDEILDDLEHGATKFRDNYTSVITGFKQGGNFTEGAIFVADAVKRYGNDFPSGTLFEFTEVTTGGVRRVDVRVNNGFNGNKDVFFEFKSVQDVPPTGFATQFVKDLDLPEVDNLGQLRWWFDGNKISSLPKQKFLDQLNAASIDQPIIDKLLPNITNPTKIDLLQKISQDFDQIFSIK